MRATGTWSIRIGAFLLVLAMGSWGYHAATSLSHIYGLLECSKGRVDLIPRALCQGYLFQTGLDAGDVAQIEFDGSLFEVVASADEDEQARLLAFLIRQGLAINGLDGRIGLTPLHVAVLDNNTEVARLLLTHGADPKIKDGQRGWTPVEYARHLKEKSDQPDRMPIIDLLMSFS